MDQASRSGITIKYEDENLTVVAQERETSLLPQINLPERALWRIEQQENRRQQNIEAVTAHAAEELAESVAQNAAVPNEDWLTRFFAYAQDISSEQFQTVWARILAGEIKRPGAFSLRALESIRNLDGEDARVLQTMLAPAVYTHTNSGRRQYIVPCRNADFLQEKFEVYEGLQIAMAEIGMMYSTNITYVPFLKTESNKRMFVSGSHFLLVTGNEYREKMHINCWKFTETGSELCTLIETPGSVEALRELAGQLMQGSASIEICTTVDLDKNGWGVPDTGRVIEKIK
jgi:uncharacterized repeat protein (TIGR03899 family)